MSLRRIRLRPSTQAILNGADLFQAEFLTTGQQSTLVHCLLPVDTASQTAHVRATVQEEIRHTDNSIFSLE